MWMWFEVFSKRLGARMAFLLSAPLAALSWAMIAASHHIWLILASRSKIHLNIQTDFLLTAGSSPGSSLVCSRLTERSTMLRLHTLTSGQMSWYDETSIHLLFYKRHIINTTTPQREPRNNYKQHVCSRQPLHIFRWLPHTQVTRKIHLALT